MKNRKVISLISAKGGSGKTILTATIGQALSEIGKKVLIIDADAATNGLTLFYLETVLNHYEDNNKESRGLFDDGFIVHTHQLVSLSENLKLLPATFIFNNTIDQEETKFETRIAQVINELDKHYIADVILIDNQAGSEHYTEYVIKRNVSDQILIVSEYDPISAAGIERLKGFFNKDLTYDRTWIVLNKVLPEFKDADTSFLEISKYLPPIIWNSNVVKSYSRKEIPLDFKVGNTYTISIIKLIKTLFRKSIEEELDLWLKDKEDVIKKPIYDEYAKIKSQILKYQDTTQAKSKGLSTNLLYVILIVVSLIIFVFFIYTEGLLIQSVISYSLPLLAAAVMAISRFFNDYIKKKNSGDTFKYEIEALSERLKEIELLKQSSVEQILQGEKKIS